MGFLWTATRYFLLGLFIGYLTAPRSGEQSRRILFDYVGAMLGELFAMPKGKTEEGITPMRRAQT